MEHRVSEVDECIEKIFTLLLKSYQELHNIGGNKNAKESIIYLAQLIAKKIYSKGREFPLEYWQGSNILFMLKIYNYLHNNYNLKILKLAIKNAYEKNSEVSFFKEFDEVDAKEVFSKWKDFSDQEDIKKKVKNWINTKEDFEEFLNYYFSDINREKIVKDKEILIHLFVASTQYLSSKILQEYFDQYHSPKTEVEWGQYIEKNRAENIGLFLLGKNNLFEYIIGAIEGFHVSSMKNGYMVELPKYISMGVKLIKKFGNNEQLVKIENLLVEITKYNDFIKEQLDLQFER